MFFHFFLVAVDRIIAARTAEINTEAHFAMQGAHDTFKKESLFHFFTFSI
jgi:hypothetical protein